MQTTKNDNSVTKSIDFVTTSVVKLVKQLGLSIATAESCTGGMLAQAITSVPGASEIFEMGIVSYSNRIKEMLLDVPEEVLERYGAVSQQTAVLMAQGAVKRSGSDIGVGITGIAGPTGATKDRPVGTVFVAVVRHIGDEQMLIVRDLAFYKEKEKYDREMIRRLTVQRALEMVLEICESERNGTENVNG